MFEPTEHEVDDDIRRSMEMFERSKIGPVAAIEPCRPTKILLALDASPQDETSMALAQGLCRRFNCPLDVVDAREQMQDNSLAERVAGSLDGRALAKPTGESYEQILDAIDRSACELVIVPCPYGRDLERLGSDSTGTVIDVLLSRSPVPLLAVRHPFPSETVPFQNVVVLLIGENEAAPLAASWAAGLVTSEGSLGLLLVLEDEAIKDALQLFRSLDSDAYVTPEMLGQAMKRSQVRLHRALEKAAEQHDFKCHFAVRREADGPLAELEGRGTHPLLVLALERRDHASQGHVHDRIRHSAHPVLIVAQE